MDSPLQLPLIVLKSKYPCHEPRISHSWRRLEPEFMQ